MFEPAAADIMGESLQNRRPQHVKRQRMPGRTDTPMFMKCGAKKTELAEYGKHNLADQPPVAGTEPFVVSEITADELIRGSGFSQHRVKRLRKNRHTGIRLCPDPGKIHFRRFFPTNTLIHCILCIFSMKIINIQRNVQKEN